ncbi:hypothetical protein N5U14_05555 [Aliarcobacter butzleri]|uniref:hypothetical protein n=1 Tax=Aliarcobacter butzleri TaxID=28197 RepID=UPI0021B3F368|nr:hypothetical protein [Aliarcobacter butzleri]MCT7610304.1 hypothetical protein [Aliarcobacter butzleri]
MIQEYSIIISSTIIIIGWGVNNYFQRKHEILKKRLDFRLEMLHSFLPVFKSISSSSNPFKDDNKLNEKIIESRIKFQLYGLKDEIDLFHLFVNSIEKADTQVATKNINELIKLIRLRIRDELNLPNNFI